MKSLPGTLDKDQSNGYEAIASTFISLRNSTIGVATVLNWAQTLSAGGTILDLGCGSGIPISRALIESGFEVYDVDASLSLTAAFRQNFPQAHIACESVEDSSFFGRQFDGVISWGLFFLLPAETQLALIQKVATALLPGSRFLFTSPSQVCTWEDNLTKRQSQSLGASAYRAALTAVGLKLINEYEDEGNNHYYNAVK
jgi:2-polyprenyl-3-methyl-5-hydroxy-6-metoxy-1,4-benzoquinol methylase